MSLPVKASEVADLLIATGSFKEFAQATMPPWIDADDPRPRNDWVHVKNLSRQTDELVAIMPHKAEQIRAEFKETVTTVALALMAYVYSKE